MFQIVSMPKKDKYGGRTRFFSKNILILLLFFPVVPGLRPPPPPVHGSGQLHVRGVRGVHRVRMGVRQVNWNGRTFIDLTIK